MKKNAIILASILVLAAAIFVVGCSPSDVVSYKVGDKIGDGFEVTFVDSAGGFIAQKKADDGTAAKEDGKNVMKVSGKFADENQTFGADSIWYLENLVFIGDDTTAGAVTLTIEAGTLIKGISSVTPGTLVITRNSKIMAEGTKAKPIIMTSALPRGSRGAGDWGGLVINGNAQLNVEGGTAQGEGNSGTYGGGSDPVNDESSGTLKYVRVEFAGRVFTSEDELNGIAFQAVGSGTTVDYIQVHQNKDDGVEFFGGAVNVSHVVLTGNQDDSLDWTSGWIGKADHVVIQQYPGTGDRLIEADNLEDANDATPRSNPTLTNFTMVGSDSSSKGCTFRRGTSVTLKNSIITNAGAGEGIAHDTVETVEYKGIVLDNTAASTVMTPDGTADNTGFKGVYTDTTGDDWNDDPDDGDYPVDYVPLDIINPSLGGATPDTATSDYIGAVDYNTVTDNDNAWYSGWIQQDIN